MLPVKVSSNKDENVEKVKLIYQPYLWNFLRFNLKSSNDISADYSGMKGGSSFGNNSRGGNVDVSSPYDNDGEMEDSDVETLTRRRSIHMLKLIIDKEYEMKQVLQRSVESGKTWMRILIWKKFILCFESLEMENEVHLVDQVWETVIDLCMVCASKSEEKIDDTPLPSLNWEWVGSLFARVLLSDSPTIRKSCLHRFLTGKAGISIDLPTVVKESKFKDEQKENNGKKGKSSQKKAKSKNKKNIQKSAPIDIVSPSFALHDLVQSYDSLSTQNGTGVQLEIDGKKFNEDLSLLVGPFITTFVRAISSQPGILNKFMEVLLSERFIKKTRLRTLVLVYNAVGDVWSTSEYQKVEFTLTSEILNLATRAIQALCVTGNAVHLFKQSILRDLSQILSHSSLESAGQPNLMLILKTLSLFPTVEETNLDPHPESKMCHSYLEKWVQKIGTDWSTNAGAGSASAFVAGQLVSFPESPPGISTGLVITTGNERQIGSSIVKLCVAASASGNVAASGMLWPAISKGLSYSSILSQKQVIQSSAQILPLSSLQKIARAMILLEYGCKEYVLSGIGHGDLVVDKSNRMLPPPPNIELLLSYGIHFLLHQVHCASVCNTEKKDEKDKEIYVARSDISTSFSNHFALLIRQISVLKKAYPSSNFLTNAVHGLLRSSLDKIVLLSTQAPTQNIENIEVVKLMSIAFGILSIGGEDMSSVFESIDKEETKEVHVRDVLQDCDVMLKLNFKAPKDIARWQAKALQSIFQYAKWGCLSQIVPTVFKRVDADRKRLTKFHYDIIETSLDSVNAVPSNAILCLFETAISSAKYVLTSGGSEWSANKYTQELKKIIEALFAIMNDTIHNPTRAYMLQVCCSLLFRSNLLSEEYHILQNAIDIEGEYGSTSNAPILCAFRKLIKMAGTTRPYISKYAISYISVGWMGRSENVEAGLSAIPYRDDICELLVHKEMKIDEGSAHQEALVHQSGRSSDDLYNCAKLPKYTPATSTVRGFLLIFFSKLPSQDDLSEVVLKDLCHYIIFWLLDNICCAESPSGTKLMTGSLDYCRKIRAWQSLCVLSGYVSEDIAQAVSKKVFDSMSLILHGQIRYFMEIFAIQCSRRHPKVFGTDLIDQMMRFDLSQQQVSSLMIISGNLIVGEYELDFFKPLQEKGKLRVQKILSGSIPWLSSTQGFNRGIAQLLVHKLIPIIAPQVRAHPKSMATTDLEDKEWFVKTIWDFLESNSDMKRLRKKQMRFFNSYNADETCTPEYILGCQVDEGDECNPPHMVDILKRCLKEIYEEVHGSDAPEWKVMEEYLHQEKVVVEYENDDESLVNFQRKILPVDSLNLSLETYRQQKLRNGAGRARQSLIVCASLIDKAPNLAGLCRTAEIFAAEKLIVPDIKVAKMDNFKNISVGAEQWIDIEECKENVLLPWLQKQKENGYSVVGVEQTSSSISLSKLEFPKKTVLLLGKEKEGIPVEFLQVIDRCVEIPQLGIIRSLNVHVSGAISIWEYTKQMMK